VIFGTVADTTHSSINQKGREYFLGEGSIQGNHLPGDEKLTRYLQQEDRQSLSRERNLMETWLGIRHSTQDSINTGYKFGKESKKKQKKLYTSMRPQIVIHLARLQHNRLLALAITTLYVLGN
jgi:hypothetical protein